MSAQILACIFTPELSCVCAASVVVLNAKHEISSSLIVEFLEKSVLIIFNCIFKGSYVNDFNHNRDDFNIKCARLLGGFYFLIPLTRLGSLKLYIDIEDIYSTLANKILFRYNIRIYGIGLIIYGLYVYCLFYLQQCPK